MDTERRSNHSAGAASEADRGRRSRRNGATREVPARRRGLGTLRPERAPLGSSFAALLDRMLATAPDGQVTSIAIVPAGAIGTPWRPAAGLAAEAARRGLNAVAAIVEPRKGKAVVRIKGRTSRGASTPPLTIEPRKKADASALAAWLRSATRNADLLIIAAPALGSSLVSVLVANAVDGLVITAEAGTTSQSELRRAAEDARKCRCHVFGVALQSPPRGLSRWVRSF